MRQIFLSDSSAQLNWLIMGVTSGWALLNASGLAAGMQVAFVNMSTNFSMKNLGNVPPRFEKLDFKC